MLPVQQAESILFNLVRSLDGRDNAEVVDLSAATGRILAAPLTSQLDFPHWDNSAMDGYAVRYTDVQACSAEHPAILTIAEEIPAGYQPQQTLQPGQAARILTGACLPAGADTVVMQENAQRDGDRVFILEAPQPQAFVRHRASFYRAGTPLLEPGTLLGAAEIAVLAAAQCTQLPVYRRPRAAIFSTGNELVPPSQPLQPGQIVDSNRYALAAFVTQAGGVPVTFGIVPDEPESLKETIIRAAASADVILSTGGVSVGDYDYIESILGQLGATLHVRSVAIKPGKPLTLATLPGAAGREVLYFGLPGNPASALVCCWRFVQPALLKLAGLPESAWRPKFVRATARCELRASGQRETYLWGQLQLVDGTYAFELAGGSHSSGNLINLAQTTGLAVIPVGQTTIPAGKSVQVLPVGSTLMAPR
jgi:molybdopterin molybdotransferase